MRKLVVSMNVTLDGYMSGPQCELDWHLRYWNEEMSRLIGVQLSEADTILLGRVTYAAMSQYWPARAADLSVPREDIAFAEMMNRYPKVVFSRTQEYGEWPNSRFVKNGLKREITRLKATPGRDLIVYGSGSLVRTLMQQRLVDRYVLWLHPVLLGQGKALFRYQPDMLDLQLTSTRVFESGVIVLSYERC
ncbi:dihydrofolate reductase family protein [Terrimonas ferruginea]|uniref:dihydrofolate reductase family protein n=1 Tax=Terrimonas ferruginea TaxID=249 RepID=UPI000491D7A4|nr:dihydrofolate reductase family protein [Terrimonas ferruginea]